LKRIDQIASSCGPNIDTCLMVCSQF
jgi:hypothetical protein